MSAPPLEHDSFSFWSAHPSSIASFKSSERPPDRAKAVVIGSGFSGTSIAYHLLEAGVKDIVVLEARQACSGASGRNGGHLAPAYWFTSHGKERIKAGTFERMNHEAIIGMVKEHNIECNVDKNLTCKAWQLYHDEEKFEIAKAKIEYLKAKGNKYLLEGVSLYGPDDAYKIFDYFKNSKASPAKRPPIHGALQYPATPINPYLLVTSIMKKNLERGVKLYTNTPVTSLKKYQDGKWKVEFEGDHKGEIIADSVYVASNAYTPDILKSFPVKPTRDQICRWDFPAERLAGWPINDGGRVSIDFHGEYMVVLPSQTPGHLSVVLGGGTVSHTDPRHRTYDDNSLDPVVGANLRRIAREELGIDEEPVQEWSGIIGWADREQPHVGSLDENLYVSAAFTGHGMPRVFLSAKACVEYSHTGSFPEWFPEEYRQLPK